MIHKYWSLTSLRQKVDYSALNDTVKVLNSYIERNGELLTSFVGLLHFNGTGGKLPMKAAIIAVKQTNAHYSTERALDLLAALREMKLMQLE